MVYSLYVSLALHCSNTMSSDSILDNLCTHVGSAAAQHKYSSRNVPAVASGVASCTMPDKHHVHHCEDPPVVIGSLSAPGSLRDSSCFRCPSMCHALPLMSKSACISH